MSQPASQGVVDWTEDCRDQDYHHIEQNRQAVKIAVKRCVVYFGRICFGSANWGRETAVYHKAKQK